MYVADDDAMHRYVTYEPNGMFMTTRVDDVTKKKIDERRDDYRQIKNSSAIFTLRDGNEVIDRHITMTTDRDGYMQDKRSPRNKGDG